jgi:CRISPR-associated protein Cas5d
LQHENIVEFELTGDWALFSDPITRIGGEKFSYQIPTYEAIKGALQSVYAKPTFIWVIDSVRVMNQIQTEAKGIRPIKYTSPENDLSYYTYLKDCRYQVRAHFIWNENRPELAGDRNENKHYFIAKRMIERGGRRDIFLGTRECQGYVEPCVYGEGQGAYDSVPEMDFGLMYHGITYPDEAYSDETRGKMTIRLWRAKMIRGEILYPPPQDCIHRPVRDMAMKPFGEKYGNFSGLGEFKEVE